MTWNRVVKSSNSKTLLHQITFLIEEGIDDMGIIWSSDTHRESFVDLVDDWLADKADEGLIQQWNVVCDLRNNKIADMEASRFILDIYFKQVHCVNMTQVRYTIDDNEELTLDFEL